MAYVRADRVMETSTTTGTGAFTLAGAVSGFRAFSAVCSVSDTLHYYIELVGATGIPTGEWETGLGTYSGANTLTRTTVIASSNGGAAVNFSAGTKRVAISHITAAVLATQNNLSDLASASAARTNLGLVAGGAGDIWVEKAGDTMTGDLNIPSLFSGSGISTGDVQFEHGGNRTGDGNVYIDFHATASSDFEARFLRLAGVNGGGGFEHTGTGEFYFKNSGAAIQTFYTNNVERGRWSTTGDFQMGGANTVIDSDRLHRLRSYTVATLPTVGTAGRLAKVTDANAPTYNATVAGGGAVDIPVYDNGTNWTCH